MSAASLGSSTRSRSNNEQAVEVIRRLRNKIRYYQAIDSIRPAGLEESALTHLPILDGLETGDAAAAERAMRHHLQVGRPRVHGSEDLNNAGNH